MSRASPLAAILLCAGCSAPFGVGIRDAPVRPFADAQFGTYEPAPAPPPLTLERPLRVVLLHFKDKRRLKFPPVDRIWSPEAEGLGRHAQPREPRGLLLRGLAGGLRRVDKLRLVAPAEYTPEAVDLVIGGEILECALSASFTKYRAATRLSVRLWDRGGRPLLAKPIELGGSFSKDIYPKLKHWRTPSEAEPLPPSPAVELSMEDALNRLFRDESFLGAIHSLAAEESRDDPQ